MKVTKKIRLELGVRGITPMVDAVQGDSLVELECTLTEYGIPWIIPAGTNIVVRFRNADGSGGIYDTMENGAAAYTCSGNVLQVQLAPQIFYVDGKTDLQIVMMQAGEQISAFAVIVRTQREITAESGPGDYTNLAKWLESVGGAGGGGETPGTAGITPKLRISESTNMWEVSYDEGATWTSLEVKATGDTPARGVDYWTEEDKVAMVSDVLAALPAAEEASF